MKELFEWAILVMAATTIFCMTRKYWWAPIIGLIQEGVWFGYVFLVGSLPLFITTVIFTIMYATAIPKWSREKRGIPKWIQEKL